MLAAASQAFACPVCFNAREDVLPAFYGTALTLTLLPFIVIGSVGFGVHRYLRRAGATGLGPEPSRGGTSSHSEGD